MPRKKYQLKSQLLITEASITKDDLKKIIEEFSYYVAWLSEADPEEKLGSWKLVNFGTQSIPIKNLVKNGGARIIKLFSKYDSKEVLSAMEGLLGSYEKFAKERIKSPPPDFFPDDLLDQEKKEIEEKDTYDIKELAVYTTDDGPVEFGVLMDPNKKIVGFVGLQDPKKDCNNATQIKYVAVSKKYQGKGIGGFLYRLGGIMAEEYLGKSGITSDHTESSTKAAQNVWNRLSKHFDEYENQSGNSEYDYDGTATPDDTDDDCNLPSQGAAATDYTWSIKDSSRSKTQSILNKMLTNASTLGPIDNIEEQMMELWDQVYAASAAAGLAESANKYRSRWEVLAGIKS